MTTTDFYGSICGCPNTDTICPGAINSPTTGWPPRGFYTEGTNGSINILAVCKNPGHPLPHETKLYTGLTGRDIAIAHIRFAAETFRREHDTDVVARRSTRFHKNLLRYLSMFLDVPESRVFESVVYTNLVKCSSFDERARLKPRTMNECFVRHFLREIEYFKPQLLLACSREVEKFLISARVKGLHQLPVIYVKHPSYHYRRNDEQRILSEIKADIQKLIRPDLTKNV